MRELALLLELMTFHIFIALLLLANIAPSTCLIIKESLKGNEACEPPPLFTPQPNPEFTTSSKTTVSWGEFNKVFTEGEVADALRQLQLREIEIFVRWVYEAVQKQEDLNKGCASPDWEEYQQCRGHNPYWKSIACLLNDDPLFALSPPKDGAAFWSGGIHTSYYARAKGKTTLENTRGARVFDLMNKYWGSGDNTRTLPIPWKDIGPLWNNLSRMYASNVKGNVDVYMRMPDATSVLYLQEYPNLKSRKQNKQIEEIYFVFLMGPTPEAGPDEDKNKQVAVANMISTGRFSHTQMEQLASTWGLAEANALDVANQLLACQYVSMAGKCKERPWALAGPFSCKTKNHGFKWVDKAYEVRVPDNVNLHEFCHSQVRGKIAGDEIGFLTDPWGWLDKSGTLGQLVKEDTDDFVENMA